MMNVTGAIATICCVILFPSLAFGDASEKIPVGASSEVLGYAPLWAADKKGFFAREGLDVDVTVTRGTSPSMQALVAGSIKVALAANDGAIGLVGKGVDLAMIAAGAKTTHMIMGRKDIKSYEDLRGKTIGSSTLTSGTAFLLRRVLRGQRTGVSEGLFAGERRRQRAGFDGFDLGKRRRGDSRRAAQF